MGGACKERQPALNTPDPSYHGAVWVEATAPLGPVAYIIKARTTLLRDLGSCMSPFNAFLFINGLETLALRMQKHSENAVQVADWLATRSDVSKVIFPGHQSGEFRARADKYMNGGYGSLVGFELKGGRDGRPQVHRLAGNALSRRQHRRLSLAGHPSGKYDP